MTKSKLYEFAESELDLAGIGDKDADYNGELKTCVLQLVDVFSKQGHSGYSAFRTLELFNKVANWKPISNLTSNPNEWTEVSEGMWQSKRNPSCFSKDGGRTWYDLDELRITNVAKDNSKD